MVQFVPDIHTFKGTASVIEVNDTDGNLIATIYGIGTSSIRILSKYPTLIKTAAIDPVFKFDMRISFERSST